MAAMVALEEAPLVLLGVEVRAVAGQGDHLQPRARAGQCRPREPC